jgi:uncharacterized protein
MLVKSSALIFISIVALSLSSCTAAESTPEIIELNSGTHTIRAEVAATEAQQAQGLMYRKELASNNGMLFVFAEKWDICMWMKNTYIPLSVAFLEDDGTVINILDMQPNTEQHHCAIRPAKFALEMQQGWFSSNGIMPGMRIKKR